MPSIIEGYKYDIFISYRQKDNKGDRWVSNFVDALKTELEATFKEDVSVYFDENPNDRLQETHNVDKSLEGKLNCLIFIPVLSQTYCDPGSYAWQNEFLAFLRRTERDRFGKDIKLRSGNVASRILPVRIHDLEPEDLKLFEKETGSALRSIDFIFKTATGVSRPLKANEDHPQDNINKTFYSDQINKTGHAAKDIIMGMKTESGEKEKEKNEPLSDFNKVTGKEEEGKVSTPLHRKVLNKRTITVSVIALVLIILGLIFIPGLFKPGAELEKSIAVLPFINDSPDEDNSYIINGLMDEILINLQKISDLVVPSRNSVEQFREKNRPSTPDIARKLGVNYIVEGSGQKFGNRLRLRVQLIVVSKGKEKHLWGKIYENEINKPEDYFDIQSEVAESIAAELKAVMTPVEKQLVNKVSTYDLTAYDLFLKANKYREEYNKTHDLSSYQTAVNLYSAALETDKKFARAYVGLAWAYSDRYYWPEYFKEDFLDSCLALVNMALSIDDKLDEAYYLRGVYYRQRGNINRALISFDKTIEINPNFYSAFTAKGLLYSYVLFDNVKGLENYHKALTLISADERPPLLRTLGGIYADLGFFEKAKYYYQEAFNISNDHTAYLWNLTGIEFRLENYEKALKLCKKIQDIDSTWIVNQHYYLYPPGHVDEAYIHANKLIESHKRSGTPMYYFSHRIGYTFYQVGRFKEADYYLKQQIRYSEESIKLNRPYAQNMASHYDLSATYAFLGDKAKAYQHLDEYNKMGYFTLNHISFVENDPLYASIRNEERFQKIVQNMKAKNQAEHERVKKWLEEQGML